MQIAVFVARTASPRNVDRQHILAGPDGMAVGIGDGRGQMQRFGIRQNRTARCHDKHINSMRKCDVAHTGRFGQTTHAIELNAKDLGEAITRNAGCVLQRHKRLVNGNGGGMFA